MTDKKAAGPLLKAGALFVPSIFVSRWIEITCPVLVRQDSPRENKVAIITGGVRGTYRFS